MTDWAKQRAKRERINAVRSVPLPDGWTGPGQCRWCLDPIVAKRAKQMHWHPACKDEWMLHALLPVQFDFLTRRDGCKCAKCGETPMRWLAGPEYVTTRGTCIDPNADWARPFWPAPTGKWADRTPEERRTGAHREIERVHDLQVDHRVPLWAVAHLPPDERRPYFGPRNLWILCGRCHKAKTKEEAARRARLRKADWLKGV